MNRNLLGAKERKTKNPKPSATTLMSEIDMYSPKNEKEAAKWFLFELKSRGSIDKDSIFNKEITDYASNVMTERESKGLKYKKKDFKLIVEHFHKLIFK